MNLLNSLYGKLNADWSITTFYIQIFCIMTAIKNYLHLNHGNLFFVL